MDTGTEQEIILNTEKARKVIFGKNRLAFNQNKYFGQAMACFLRSSQIKYKHMFRWHITFPWKGEKVFVNLINMGARMERMTDELKIAAEEALEANMQFQNIFNDLVTTQSLIEPKIAEMVQRIRTHRANTTIELNKALKTMREVRQFFLESDYKKEIQRLEQFVVLAERMQKLIDNGTMDIILDSAIKLAIREEG